MLYTVVGQAIQLQTLHMATCWLKMQGQPVHCTCSPCQRSHATAAHTMLSQSVNEFCIGMICTLAPYSRLLHAAATCIWAWPADKGFLPALAELQDSCDVPFTLFPMLCFFDTCSAWQVPSGVQAGEHSVCYGGSFSCSKCVLADEAS